MFAGKIVILVQHLQPNPAPEWMTDKAWTEVVMASGQLRSMQGLMSHIKDNIGEWKAFYDCANPHEEQLPKGWTNLE